MVDRSPFRTVDRQMDALARWRVRAMDAEESSPYVLIVSMFAPAPGGVLLAVGFPKSGLAMLAISLAALAVAVVLIAAGPAVRYVEDRIGAVLARRVVFDTNDLTMDDMVAAVRLTSGSGHRPPLGGFVSRSDAQKVVAERILKEMADRPGSQRVQYLCTSVGAAVAVLHDTRMKATELCDALSTLDKERYAALLAMAHIVTTEAWYNLPSKKQVPQDLVVLAHQLSEMSDHQVQVALALVSNTWSGSAQDLLAVSSRISS